METLDPYLDDCERVERGVFAKIHAHPWLVVVANEPDEGDRWRVFRTTNISARRLAQKPDYPSIQAAYRVLKVVKAGDSPWSNRVSIGRARNNDIVVRHRSVSKLHAHFFVDDDQGMSLADAGSRNGTRVNGRRLAANETVLLAANDELRFGSVDAIYKTPLEFYDFLQNILAGPRVGPT